MSYKDTEIKAVSDARAAEQTKADGNAALSKKINETAKRLEMVETRIFRIAAFDEDGKEIFELVSTDDPDMVIERFQSWASRNLKARIDSDLSSIQ